MFRVYQTAASGPDVHHDTLLSNIAVAAFDDGTTDGLIADQLFPSIPVAKQSDRYLIIDKGNFLRAGYDALRAPRTAARKIEFQVSSDTYFADNYALACDTALEDLDNADNVFALRENNTRLIIGQLRRSQEIRVADLVTSISNVGSGVALSGTNLWSDYINSDPIGDVNTAHAFIQRTTGLVANTMALDIDVFRIVRRHPDLIDLYKYVSGGQLTADQVAAAFDVQRLLISRAVKENALEGGVSSMTNIWNKAVVLAHVNPAATTQRVQTLGARFNWRPGSFPAPLAASTRREEGAGTRNVEIVQTEHYQDEKIVAANLGYTITGAVA